MLVNIHFSNYHIWKPFVPVYARVVTLKYYLTVLFNFTVLNIFEACLDILVSKVSRVKPTFCEHFLIHVLFYLFHLEAEFFIPPDRFLLRTKLKILSLQSFIGFKDLDSKL